MEPHYCVCRSFSTWWAITGQYKDFKEIQDLNNYIAYIFISPSGITSEQQKKKKLILLVATC